MRSDEHVRGRSTSLGWLSANNIGPKSKMEEMAEKSKVHPFFLSGCDKACLRLLLLLATILLYTINASTHDVCKMCMSSKLYGNCIASALISRANSRHTDTHTRMKLHFIRMLCRMLYMCTSISKTNQLLIHTHTNKHRHNHVCYTALRSTHTHTCEDVDCLGHRKGEKMLELVLHIQKHTFSLYDIRDTHARICTGPLGRLLSDA